jgi:sialic acid synthase SpsE
MKHIELTKKRWIGEGEFPYIIAEAGINHNGDFDIAKKIIFEASKCGADAVKFQKRTIEEMYTQEFLNQPYFKSYAFGTTYGEHKKHLEFNDEQYFELQEYAKTLNIDFLVSGFDFISFDFIENKLNVPIHKIASPFITHFPLLKKIAEYGKPMILSTGMHCLNEIKEAIEYIKPINEKIVLLQATTLYPCQDEDVNLNVLKTFKREFDLLVGYSSHDTGVILPAASVALGACIIEKHFTLDRTMIGPDHIASVEPRGLELICKYSKSVYKGLGKEEKNIHESEKSQRLKYGVSIVSTNDIKKETAIAARDITVKCPGGGISPVIFEKLIGKIAAKDIKADSIIYEGDIINYGEISPI